jgi:hypothetical protein
MCAGRTGEAVNEFTFKPEVKPYGKVGMGLQVNA